MLSILLALSSISAQGFGTTGEPAPLGPEPSLYPSRPSAASDANAGAEETEQDRYQVRIHVERRHVNVTAHLDYRVRTDGVRSISFYLPKELTFARVECPGLASHEFAPDGSFVSEVAHALTLNLQAPRDAGDRLPITLQYSGVVPGAFEGPWVEFFADHNFAPLHTSMTRRPLYECELSIVEDGYRVFGFGEVESRDGGWILRSTRPCGDLPMVALPGLEIADQSRDEYRVRIAHVGVPDEALARLVEQASWILGYYNDTFGVDEPRNEVGFVIRPTERSLGYARPGYIVLSGDALDEPSDPDGPPGFASERPVDTSHFAFIAHEIAHLWWMLGDPSGFENWLNESFAEFASMLAVRERFGDRPYLNDLDRKQEEARDLPAVLGIERTSPHSHLVFYRKGPLILNRLYERLGEGDFLELLVLMQSEQVRTTEHMLALVKESYGEEETSWLRAELSR